jgi:PAS domain S-box-containing protein
MMEKKLDAEKPLVRISKEMNRVIKKWESTFGSEESALIVRRYDKDKESENGHTARAVVLNLLEELEGIRSSLEEARCSISESEEKFSKVFHTSPDSVTITRLSDGRFVDSNEGFTKLSGYSKEEVMGKTSLDMDLWSDQKDRERFIEALGRKGEISGYESEFRMKNGDIKTGSIAAKIIEIEGERCLLSIIRDITERKKTEDALRESEQQYRTLVETSPDAITLTDTLGNFITVNQQAALLHGFESVDDMLSSGKTAFDLIAPEDGKRAIDNVKKTLEIGGIHSSEYTLLRNDGTTVPAELSASVVKNSKGKVKGFIGVMRDISERKKTELALQSAINNMEVKVKQRTADLLLANEELKKAIDTCNLTQSALKESEELFRIVTEGALAGVYIIQEGKFKYVNPALAQIFGYSSDELIEKVGPLELTHPDDQALVAEQLRRRLSGELEAVHYMFRGLGKDGTVIYCQVLSRSLEYMGAKAVIGTLIDITEHKKSEDEMKRKLMKFQLTEGKLYLVKEPVPTMAHEAFIELLDVGYHGYVISRSPEEEFRKHIDLEFVFSWLSERGPGFQKPILSSIEKELEVLNNKHTILIEGLDYLIFKFGFKKTLSFIQDLREIAYLGGHIAIIALDPSTIKKKELNILGKETHEIETSQFQNMPESLLEVLRFVYKQNVIGVKPSYTDVGKNLGISKPTVQKRIGLLNSAGYIHVLAGGRRKTVELAERGRSLLLR